MRIFSILGLAVLVALISLGQTAPAYAADSNSFTITASNWKFAPGTIDVKIGQKITLHLTSSAGVHGIKSDELGIANTVIQPGKTTDVSFTATKPGTYKVYCVIPCGPGHSTMVLLIKVD